MARPLLARIDLSALNYNFTQVKHCAPHAKVLAVVKANAYGHGAVQVAQCLTQADGFAVASIEEALLLREAKIKQSIVVLGSFFSEADLKTIQAYHLTIAIHHVDQVALLRHSSLSAPLKIWLHVDTAMHNLGLSVEQLPRIITQLESLAHIEIETLMTHFSNADQLHDPTTERQMVAFKAATQNYRWPCSLANSAAILGWQHSHAQWVRPGLMLYGAMPAALKKATEVQLRPVMTLESKIIAIRQLIAGESVGYGATWVCPRAMSVATVAVGYGDGYPRHAKVGTPVLVNGKRCPLVAVVAMDLITIDLTPAPDAQLGDPVILWGQDLAVEEIATYADTIPHHCLANLHHRIPRVYS